MSSSCSVCSLSSRTTLHAAWFSSPASALGTACLQCQDTPTPLPTCQFGKRLRVQSSTQAEREILPKHQAITAQPLSLLKCSVCSLGAVLLVSAWCSLWSWLCFRKKKVIHNPPGLLFRYTGVNRRVAPAEHTAVLSKKPTCLPLKESVTR